VALDFELESNLPGLCEDRLPFFGSNVMFRNGVNRATRTHGWKRMRPGRA